MKITLAASLAFLMAPVLGWAVLGQPVTSVRSDAAHMRGTARPAAKHGYSVQTITTAYGEVVNEYVSPAGMVFGVSWKGPAMPNLSQLLGSYFPQFQKASASAAHRRRALVVQTQQVVVESGGHMHGFQGRAYVPGLVPANLPPSIVQ